MITPLLDLSVDPSKVAEKVRNDLSDPSITVLVSSASAWEIASTIDTRA